jgi:hypothetical protein
MWRFWTRLPHNVWGISLHAIANHLSFNTWRLAPKFRNGASPGNANTENRSQPFSDTYRKIRKPSWPGSFFCGGPIKAWRRDCSLNNHLKTLLKTYGKLGGNKRPTRLAHFFSQNRLLSDVSSLGVCYLHRGEIDKALEWRVNTARHAATGPPQTATNLQRNQTYGNVPKWLPSITN